MVNTNNSPSSRNEQIDLEEVNGVPVSNLDKLTDDTIKDKAENVKERGFKEGLQDNSDNEPVQPQQQ